jgi:hypothetical protein
MPPCLRHFCKVLLALPLCSLAFSQQPPHPADHAEVARSKWDASLAPYGLTADLYRDNHLSRLNTEEIKNIMLAGWSTGWDDAMNSVVPSCGPEAKAPDRSTVKLLLDIPDSTDTEAASSVRAHLRAIPDIRIVFSEPDADATLHFLAVQTRSKSSGVVYGYVLTYVASRPCSLQLAKGVYRHDLILAHDLETAGTVEEVVKSVISDVDVRVCEKVRRWNAYAIKESKESAVR